MFHRKEGNIVFNDALNTFYAHMVSDIWLWTIQIIRDKTHCCLFMSYSFWLAARAILYAPFHRQDSTYHSICYTSCGALAAVTNRIPPRGIDLMTNCIMSGLFDNDGMFDVRWIMLFVFVCGRSWRTRATCARPSSTSLRQATGRQPSTCTELTTPGTKPIG